jgi:sulfocyanin
MLRRAVLALAVLVFSAGSPRLLSVPAARAAATPTFVAWNAATKTATVTLIAAYNQVGGGFNFDGYNNGGLTITVPTGARVSVQFTNLAPLPHSAVITPYADHAKTGNFPLAFAGSATPNPTTGMANLRKPEAFSFTASKAGMYAVVCGVPGHALAGMWIAFDVANVSTATATASGRASTGGQVTVASSCGRGDSANGSVQGNVVDASTNKPLAHVFVVVGWTTLKRVAETDAKGQYCVEHLKPAYVDAFGFAQGYIYYHGHPISIRPGKSVLYSFKMAHQDYPASELPSLSGATISPMSLAAGATATFAVHVMPGKPGTMSAEVFAVNSMLGQSVLLQHHGGDVYSGTLQVPAGTKAGTYRFAFFGAMLNCLENAPYPTVTLTVTG